MKENMEVTYVFLVLLACIIHFNSSDAAICGWDTVWYNTSAPSAANNFTESELPPDATVLNTVCGTGNPFKLRCRTIGDVSFEVFLNDTGHHYFALCTATIGLKCTPWPGVDNAQCPDFSIQLGCDCPTTATSPVVASATKPNFNIGISSDSSGSKSTAPFIMTGAQSIENSPLTGRSGTLFSSVTHRSTFPSGGVGYASSGQMSGSVTANGYGNENTAGTGFIIGAGNTNRYGIDSSGNGNFAGTENTDGSGKGSANSGSTGNTTAVGHETGGTGSSGYQSGSGSSVANSKSGGRNGSAFQKSSISFLWLCVLLTLYCFNN